MTPLVSIIIPAFNRAHIIGETLDSIIKQTYINWECIVVDDGSDDGTIDVLKKYKEKENRFKYFKRPLLKEKGSSSCRNLGIAAATGEYIIFLDSDDLLASDCLRNRVEVFNNNLDNDFVVFQMQIFKTETPDLLLKSSKKVVLSKIEIKEKFFSLQSVWQITCPIYRLKYIRKIGGFNEQLRVFTDLELAVRAVFYATNYKMVGTIDCYYRNNEAYYEKHKKISFVTKVVESFERYCIIIHNEVINNEQFKFNTLLYKSYLVTNYKNFFKEYLLQFSPSFFSNNKKIVHFLYVNDYLSFNERLKFCLVSKILLKFYKIKGLGVYRLINYLMK